MDPVQFPNYIHQVIYMLEASEISLTQAFSQIAFLVADVDNLVNMNNMDIGEILMNRHVNSLVHKLNEPLDIENMINYNANNQSNFNNQPNSQILRNRQMIENVVAFILKEINQNWIFNQNVLTDIPLFLSNTNHVSSYIPASFLQQYISQEERERQSNYKRKREHEYEY
jgi:hypothetical protein